MRMPIRSHAPQQPRTLLHNPARPERRAVDIEAIHRAWRCLAVVQAHVVAEHLVGELLERTQVGGRERGLILLLERWEILVGKRRPVGGHEVECPMIPSGTHSHAHTSSRVQAQRHDDEPEGVFVAVVVARQELLVDLGVSCDTQRQIDAGHEVILVYEVGKKENVLLQIVHRRQLEHFQALLDAISSGHVGCRYTTNRTAGGDRGEIEDAGGICGDPHKVSTPQDREAAQKPCPETIACGEVGCRDPAPSRHLCD